MNPNKDISGKTKARRLTYVDKNAYLEVPPKPGEIVAFPDHPTKTRRFYKVLGPTGNSVNGGYYTYDIPTVLETSDGTKVLRAGEWTFPVTGIVEPCENGYHLTDAVDVQYWVNMSDHSDLQVYLAQGRGSEDVSGTKTAYRSARLLQHLMGQREWYMYCIDCIEHLLPIWNAWFTQNTSTLSTYSGYQQDLLPDTIKWLRAYAGSGFAPQSLGAARSVWSSIDPMFTQNRTSWIYDLNNAVKSLIDCTPTRACHEVMWLRKMTSNCVAGSIQIRPSVYGMTSWAKERQWHDDRFMQYLGEPSHAPMTTMKEENSSDRYIHQVNKD